MRALSQQIELMGQCPLREKRRTSQFEMITVSPCKLHTRLASGARLMVGELNIYSSESHTSDAENGYLFAAIWDCRRSAFEGLK